MAAEGGRCGGKGVRARAYLMVFGRRRGGGGEAPCTCALGGGKAQAHDHEAQVAGGAERQRGRHHVQA
jgi:hypothetical protein